MSMWLCYFWDRGNLNKVCPYSWEIITVSEATLKPIQGSKNSNIIQAWTTNKKMVLRTGIWVRIEYIAHFNCNGRVLANFWVKVCSYSAFSFFSYFLLILLVRLTQLTREEQLLLVPELFMTAVAQEDVIPIMRIIPLQSVLVPERQSFLILLLLTQRVVMITCIYMMAIQLRVRW